MIAHAADAVIADALIDDALIDDALIDDALNARVPSSYPCSSS